MIIVKIRIFRIKIIDKDWYSDIFLAIYGMGP